MAPLQCSGILLLASLSSLLGGCSPRSDAATGANAVTDVVPPLAFTVNDARATHRLATSSTLESKEAAAGNQFVVLDVSVLNPDSDPQALLEGTLVAMGDSGVQTFDTPVSLLSDDYLGLQVLAPGQGVRGKIAYEVPEDLQGVLYWSPSSGRRILLHVSPSQPTLADAGPDDALQPPSAAAAGIATAADAAPARADPRPSRAASPVLAIPVPTPIRTRAVAAAMPPAPAGVSMDTVAAPAPATTMTTTIAAPMPSAGAPRVTAAVATPAPEAGASRVIPAPTVASAASAAAPSAMSPLDVWVAEQGSALRSAPPRIPPPSVATAGAGQAPACDAPARAARLVCEDAVLSAMDIRLDRSIERAGDYVNPGALQREQAEWSERVRNACDTAACLEQVYRSRQARVDALTPGVP